MWLFFGCLAVGNLCIYIYIYIYIRFDGIAILDLFDVVNRTVLLMDELFLPLSVII